MSIYKGPHNNGQVLSTQQIKVHRAQFALICDTAVSQGPMNLKRIDTIILNGILHAAPFLAVHAPQLRRMHHPVHMLTGTLHQGQANGQIIGLAVL